MIVTTSRKSGRPWHSYRQETNDAITATTNTILVGTNQRIRGYRGERLRPMWRCLHPVELVKEVLSSDPLHPDNKVKVLTHYTNGKPRYRAFWGDIAVKAIVPSNQSLTITDEERKLYASLMPGYIVKCHAKAKSPKFDGATNLGEAKETLAFLRNPLRGILQLGKSLRKGYRRGRGMSLVNYLSGQWLEYRYAIMPLVGMASDFLKVIHDKVGDGTVLYAVHSGSKRFDLSEPKVSIVSGPYNFGPTPDELFGTKTVETRVRPGVVCWVRLNEGFGSRWGLRASDIPSTMWELIPYSFMVDWVFGVGDYIRAITPNGDQRVLSSAASLCIETSTHLQGTALRIQGLDGFNLRPCATSAKYTRKVLLRETNPPLPLLPQLNGTILNWKRSLDLITIFGVAPLMKTFRKR